MRSASKLTIGFVGKLTVGLACLLTIPAAARCGGSAPPPSRPESAEATPHWEDAFETGVDVFAVVHPQAMRRDPLYGPLLRRLSAYAAARSRAVARTRTLEVIESADEVLIGVRNRGPDAVAGDADPRSEVVVVARGVRADIDPARVVDAEGRPVWTLAKEHHVERSSATFPEYQHVEAGDAHPSHASLFVLPERTWFIASGGARDRARDAFVHPFGRPHLAYDGESLLSLRLDGPTLVAHVPKLREGGNLSSIGKHLRTITFAIPRSATDPASRGATVASLAYEDEDAAAVAEITMKRVVEVMRRHPEATYGWLAGATVDRDEPRTVVVHAKLPESLLYELAHAHEAPVDDRAWPNAE